MHLAGKGKGGNPDPHASWHCNKGGQTRKKRTSLKVHFLSFFLFACFWRGDAKESLEIVNGPRSEWRIRLTDLQSVHSSHTEFLPETKKIEIGESRTGALFSGRTLYVTEEREREKRSFPPCPEYIPIFSSSLFGSSSSAQFRMKRDEGDFIDWDLIDCMGRERRNILSGIRGECPPPCPIQKGKISAPPIFREMMGFSL